MSATDANETHNGQNGGREEILPEMGAIKQLIYNIWTTQDRNALKQYWKRPENTLGSFVMRKLSQIPIFLIPGLFEIFGLSRQ